MKRFRLNLGQIRTTTREPNCDVNETTNYEHNISYPKTYQVHAFPLQDLTFHYTYEKTVAIALRM